MRRAYGAIAAAALRARRVCVKDERGDLIGAHAQTR